MYNPISPFKKFLKYQVLCICFLVFTFDRAERHEFWPRLWLFFSPFLFPPKKRGEKKSRMNSKKRDQKSCLSARSFTFFDNNQGWGFFLYKTHIICILSRIVNNTWSHFLRSWANRIESVFFLMLIEFNFIWYHDHGQGQNVWWGGVIIFSDIIIDESSGGFTVH